MRKDILQHYLKDGTFTYPGPNVDPILRNLPSNVCELGKLVRNQIIHRIRLRDYEVASSEEMEDGPKDTIPWFRQPEDAILPTASSIIAEMYRRDPRGLTYDRAIKDKLILTCRPVAILMTTILRAKGIPARVRSGFASYLPGYGNKSVDHWVTQYWDRERHLWRTIDVDGSDVITDFDPFDLPLGTFEFAADVWLGSRQGRCNPYYYWNANGDTGQRIIAWELFYDFHCLMNSETIYPHHPEIVLPQVFPNLSTEELTEIDELARLLKECDKHFDALKHLWCTNRKFRLLKGLLLYDT